MKFLTGVFGMVMEMTMLNMFSFGGRDLLRCSRASRGLIHTIYSIHELPVADLYRCSWGSGGFQKVCCTLLHQMLTTYLKAASSLAANTAETN